MKKKEPEIIVTTFFDGESQAKDLFADIIIQKYLHDHEQKQLPKTETNPYNEISVPQDQGLSGLCGETP